MAGIAIPGEIVDDRYVIARWIGRGATADVYDVVDQFSGDHVALKVLRRSRAGDERAIQRFSREAQVHGMLRHNNIARIYGAGMTRDNEPYIALELLRGYSLKNLFEAQARIDVVRASAYIWQALQGLAAAHAQGICHRDLKPANLMLEPAPGPVERVCLIDFGFAALEGGAAVTRKGEVVGSLSYLAPERLQGQEASVSSDLYSLGIILYEAVVGHRPFAAKTDYQLISKHVTEAPVPPRIANPSAGIPQPVEDFILRVLAKNPGQRPTSALAMAAELERAAESARR